MRGMSLGRWYKLRRHRLGIGVHSPFAYRMVRDVIYGKGRYYTVLKLRRLTDGYPKRVRREYGVIFRLIARLAPKAVRLSDSVEPQVELLVRLADMRPVMGRGLGGYHEGIRVLTVCDASDLSHGVPDGMLRSGNIAVVRDLHLAAGVSDMLRGAMAGGWFFADSKTAIAVSDDREPLNLIDVKMT